MFVLYLTAAAMLSLLWAASRHSSRVPSRVQRRSGPAAKVPRVRKAVYRNQAARVVGTSHLLLNPSP